MANNVDKIESLLGFAVRAGKIIYGFDNIEALRKKRYLIILDNSVSERLLRHCTEFAKSKHLPLLRIKHKKIEDIVHKLNCKVIAITDKQMSDAIIKFANDNYEVLTSEVK